jgi:hypothetical protein
VTDAGEAGPAGPGAAGAQEATKKATRTIRMKERCLFKRDSFGSDKVTR